MEKVGEFKQFLIHKDLSLEKDSNNNGEVLKIWRN